MSSEIRASVNTHAIPRKASFAAYRERYVSAATRDATAASHAAAAPVIEVLSSYGLDGDAAFYASLEFWAALHGFVLLEMTGVMDNVDTDAVFSDMVLRLAAGMALRSGSAAHDAP